MNRSHLHLRFSVFFLLSVLILSCDSNEKKAQRLFDAASGIDPEILDNLDSLISVHGDTTCFLDLEAIRQSDEKEKYGDSLKKANELLRPYREAYEENGNPVLEDTLRLRTLFWFNNGMPFGISPDGSWFNDKTGLYTLYDGSVHQILPANYAFEFSFLKDLEQLTAFINKGYVVENLFMEIIEALGQTRYITFVKTRCENKPSASVPFFSSGDILSDISVYDLESGDLVKSTSIYATNSDSLNYTRYRSVIDTYKFADDAVVQDLIDHYRKTLNRELNAVCQ